MDVIGQAGTYIKEFVHSDNDKTNPSIKSLIGSDSDIMQLDVTGMVMNFNVDNFKDDW